MRVFELENRLKSDDCAINSYNLQNRSIEDYRLFNMYPTSACDASTGQLTDFMAANPNLRFRDGFGNVNKCTVDADSKIRNDPTKLTNFREKTQLCTRWYQAVPDFGHAGLVPNVESALKLGEDTSYIKDCDRVMEKQFDVFIPFNTCGLINPDVVAPFEQGVSTRDFVRQDDYARRCGLMPRQVLSVGPKL
jgi:hypothetical protein